VQSRRYTLRFDAQSAAPRIGVPTLIVHSEKALAPALARRFFDALTAPKRELWLPSQGQFDFYDDPAIVGPAASALAGSLPCLRFSNFFRRSLATTRLYEPRVPRTWSAKVSIWQQTW
jgi:hypothetical protein